MTLRQTRVLLASALLAVTGGFVLAGPAPVAQAAACTDSGGVTVIVDYNELGGADRAGCAPNSGGKSGAAAFSEAGFALEYARRSPGFVCKVTGLPAAEPCVNTAPSDAYWSLWWSDGKSGTWTYSSAGAGSLKVPAGSYVSFAWHQGAGQPSAPGVRPVRASTAPAPDPAAPTKPAPKTDKSKPGKPTTAPATGSEPTAAPSSDSATAEPSQRPTADESPKAKATTVPISPNATASSDPTAPAADEISAGAPKDGVVVGASDADDNGLPIWLPIGAVVVVAAIGGGLAWRRRIA